MNAQPTKPGSSTKPLNVAIIGGGISGLATAFFLEREAGWANIHIDLFESNHRLGGKIKTVEHNNMLLELGAESFLARKPHGLALCRALNITDKLQNTLAHNQQTFIAKNNYLVPLPKGLSGFVPTKLKPLLTTKLLSPKARLRFLLDYVLPAKKGHADESLRTFMSRRFGNEAYERMIGPLLSGIYSGNGDNLSVAATFPQLRALEKTHGSLLKGLTKTQPPASENSRYTGFVSFRHGMSTLIESLEQQLKRTHIYKDTHVPQLNNHHDKWFFPTVNQKDYDAVVLAIPAHQAALVLEHSFETIARTLRQIKHVSTATVNLWFNASDIKHPLKGYGFVIPEREQQGVTAVTWVSSKHAHRAPQNKVLLRAYCGRAGDEASYTKPDKYYVGLALNTLKHLMGVDAQPKGYVVTHWTQGTAQYSIDHVAHCARLDHQCNVEPGLFLTGASYKGIGIPDCIRDAEATAKTILLQAEVGKIGA